jgi:hypothetical protein
LLEDEQTSKHGGGGRYNVILEFKGEQIQKILMRKEKEKMRKRKKEKEYIYIIKREKYELCKNKRK